MTAAMFLSKNGTLCGFILNGHAGKRVLCAAVSSAALLTANTITEICGCEAAIEEADGFLSLRVLDEMEKAAPHLLGLRLHLTQLREQYPKHIQVETTEV